MRMRRLDVSVIVLSALATFAVRLVALRLPLRPDEAGFLMVARAWAPTPDSVYGPYFVDRPPLLIAVVRWSDALGGPFLLRILGAAGLALVVLLAAGAAREVAGDRAARWTALVAAAYASNTMIDAVSVKGEQLALPLLTGAVWAALVCVRRRSVQLAFLAGLLGGASVGLKQNLAGALVFTAVLLLVAWRTGRVPGRCAARLGTAAGVGAAVPWLATLLWALVAGVRLPVLAYAVVGFRSDASRVIASQPSDAAEHRFLVLVAVAVAAGMVLLALGFVRHLPEAWRVDPAATAATTAMLVTDSAGLVLGGSYWTDYLVPLLPGLAMATALLIAALWQRRDRRRRALRTVVIAAALSAALSVASFVLLRLPAVDAEAVTGSAIARAAAPGDTLTVFGGGADLQHVSGLPSPYPYLWSLPMRTLDPAYTQLVTLLDGPDAPTWVVLAVSPGSWDAPGEDALRAVLEDGYVETATGCDDEPVLLRRGVTRDPLTLDCG